MLDWNKLLANTRIRESKRPHDARSAFESDFGRIIFSPAVRRMHDKTQVFPLTTDDNIHSRLTHSLEVMSVGYSLAIRFCDSEKMQKRIGWKSDALFRAISVILKNACLIHDIGNPPFGHFGESVIQEYFKGLFEENPQLFNLTEAQKRDFVHFDGNAQGLRVLTKLQNMGDSFGMNLTYATLAACMKYPNADAIDKSHIETKKVGVFQSEKEVLNKIAAACGLETEGMVVRHPLCYLVEAADSICYLTMDLEDGFNKNLFTLEELKCAIGEAFPVINEFLKNDDSDLAKISKVRNALIGHLVDMAFQNFENNIDKIENGEYNQELIFADPPLAKQLQKFCIEKIFSIEEIYTLEMTGHSVLKGLLDFFIDCIFRRSNEYRRRAVKLISSNMKQVAVQEMQVDDFEELTDYYKLRVIVDFVVGMTDKYALGFYQKISGERI